jgi:DNA-binding SARP family transcriptional activator
MRDKRAVRPGGDNAAMVAPVGPAHTKPVLSAPVEPAEAPVDEVPAAAPNNVDESAEYDRENVARVIRSKIQPPPLRGSTLSRPRLLTRLPTATDKRVTLVTAEAGYGKTTLLTDFSSRSHLRCVWYKLDSTDRDSLTMVSYLIAAAREVRPGFGASTSQLLSRLAGADTPTEAIVSRFLGELEEFKDTPTVLILDDFHTIDESAESCELVSRLIRDAPANFHFVISSRRRPPLALARLAGMGDLAEITTDELRFSRDETQRLFADAYGQPLDADVLTEVDARTEGWAASLQLLYSSIRGRPASAARSLARALSGAASPVYDFLAEEVIGHLSPELEQFLVRSALLDRIIPQRVVALCADLAPPPSAEQAAAWISDADNLGLLSRGSQTSEARQLHPLLREFLLRQLKERSTQDEIRSMHLRVAVATEGDDALAACHHYIEADEPAEAMRCLGQSVVLTMGSGQWGAASQLIGRLSAVPVEPAIAAIQARRLFEEGDIDRAAALLAHTDVANQPAAVRAVLRQTRVSMGWRSGDGGSLSATLREIGADPETPVLLKDIAQIFVDSSAGPGVSAAFPDLAKRLQGMADAQAQAGYDYYAAISLHNAAVALVSSGLYRDAVAVGLRALEAFRRVNQRVSAGSSTRSILATCAYELGRQADAHAEIRTALSCPEAGGDVYAEGAFLAAAVGSTEDAAKLLANAQRLERQGRSDMSGVFVASLAQALLWMPTHSDAAVRLVQALPRHVPLDLGTALQRDTYESLALLSAGRPEDSLRLAETSRALSIARAGRTFEVRLSLISALARSDEQGLHIAIDEAASVGELALLETADAIGTSLYLLSSLPPALATSVSRWPTRWLPVLRRQLESGDTANAHVAASLLDEHGTFEDIGRLRAYDKSYRRRSRGRGYGRALARKVSPRLEILDLGRVRLRVGERQVHLSGIRRKPASLLMYLVTRPKFTATREQVLDELWPDNDPSSAANSLNQSLYFIRREIDPWYEDDVSADYVCYESDMLWLDPELTSVASAQFMANAGTLLSDDFSKAEALALIESYAGRFSPEFEYEEWAIAWRTRVHVSFLSLASGLMTTLFARGDVAGAADVAQRALAIDPDADDIERRLVWLYSKLGATSAALAQYRHLAAREEADGLEPPSFAELTSSHRPT